MKPATLLLLAAIPAFILGVCSCGLENAITPPEHTRFLESTGTDASQRSERLPFEHAWRDPSVDISNYKHIVVRPVTTAYLRGEQWDASKSAAIPTKRAWQRRCNSLAAYWTKELNKAYSSPVCAYYKTTDTSKPGTLVIEVALTEVRFGPPAPADDPLAGKVGELTGPPLCAFEARIRDAATGKLIATVSDRRGPNMNSPAATKAAPALPNEAICDEWSRQLMEASNRDLFPKVKRRWLGIL